MQPIFYFIFLALFFINVVAFIFVGLDKRKSIKGSERFPEVDFFLWAVFFGSMGIFFGMFVFHHKTRKIYFPLGIGLLLIEQIFLLMLLRQTL